MGGSGKERRGGGGGLWPACLLGTRPLPIILLYGAFPACRPKEAFLSASSSHKSHNLSALLTTRPQRTTEGDGERETPRRCGDGGTPGKVPVEMEGGRRREGGQKNGGSRRTAVQVYGGGHFPVEPQQKRSLSLSDSCLFSCVLRCKLTWAPGRAGCAPPAPPPSGGRASDANLNR